MKRLITIFFAAFLSLSAFAEFVIPEDAIDLQLVETESLNNDDVSRDKPHKSPVLYPSIFYLENYLYVSSPYYIEEAQIIIHDEDGTIIYNTISSLASGVSVFILPQNVADDMYSIEFIYGDHDLFGLF